MRKVHIWCPRASNSALAIRESIKAKGIGAYKTWANQSGRQLLRFIHRIRHGDLLINWGAPTPDYVLAGVADGRCRVLNDAAFIDKREQLLRLEQAGVPCLEVSNRPAEGWIGRSFRHQGGYDLLHNTGRDYYTKRLNFTRELRIHVYQDMSILAGIKVPRIDNPHPWIRSYAAGWKIDYSRAKDIAQSRRELAKSALFALNLDFGAVDIGVVNGNNAVVIEVNTAPGLEGQSVEAYVRHFLEELH